MSYPLTPPSFLGTLLAMKDVTVGTLIKGNFIYLDLTPQDVKTGKYAVDFPNLVLTWAKVLIPLALRIHQVPTSQSHLHFYWELYHGSYLSSSPVFLWQVHRPLRHLSLLDLLPVMFPDFLPHLPSNSLPSSYLQHCHLPKPLSL